jgi:hypothetical protein|tara:strand:- start:118 stop:414 length:297 start_codon:yes stop_codon:yes gene_type:complete
MSTLQAVILASSLIVAALLLQNGEMEGQVRPPVLLNEVECQETFDATGEFLRIAASLISESERLRPTDPETADQRFDGFVKFSALAESYSTIFSVWCK